ncbi:MAG: hypothetical protein ACFE0R_13485 [Salinarimonas sp.]
MDLVTALKELRDISRAAEEGGIATEQLTIVADRLAQMAYIVASVDKEITDLTEDATVLTSKKRLLLQSYGFGERILSAAGSSASISAMPVWQPLLERLLSIVERIGAHIQS